MSFMNEIITCGNVQCERERPKPVLLLGRPPPPTLLSHPSPAAVGDVIPTALLFLVNM